VQVSLVDAPAVQDLGGNQLQGFAPQDLTVARLAVQAAQVALGVLTVWLLPAAQASWASQLSAVAPASHLERGLCGSWIERYRTRRQGPSRPRRLDLCR
jgi:hypothetical protein